MTAKATFSAYRQLVRDIKTLERRHKHLVRQLEQDEVLLHQRNFVLAEEAALKRTLILLHREEQCLQPNTGIKS